MDTGQSPGLGNWGKVKLLVILYSMEALIPPGPKHILPGDPCRKQTVSDPRDKDLAVQ
jgi:hypothetical protein